MLYFLLGATLLAACAAWTDWRTGHIPNELTLGGFAAAVLAHFVRGAMAGGFGGGVVQAGYALGGALLCSLVPAFMYWKGGMGGGDVKLFAAVGALLLPLGGLEAETYAFLAAALIAPAKLAYEGTLGRTLVNTVNVALNPFRAKDRRKEIPEAMVAWFRLGPAIFLGTAATLVVHLYDWRTVP